jgi:hypothetical protein
MQHCDHAKYMFNCLIAITNTSLQVGMKALKWSWIINTAYLKLVSESFHMW